MKKTFKTVALALFVLFFFASCHQCAVCGKNKLSTTKTSFLGREFYICKDCENLPASTVNGFLNELKDATDNIKDGLISVKTSITGVADEVKNDVTSVTDEIKGLFGK